MPPILEVVSGITTAPGAVITALTPAAGNSFSVRNARLDSRAFLIEAWAFNNAAGVLRIRSPKLHDNVQGIRLPVTATDATPLLHRGFSQILVPQDALTVELSGSAVAGQIETASLLLYYQDVPLQGARFIDFATLQAKGVNEMGVSLAITAGVAGGYSGQRAINADFDNFKANTDYALVGYQITAACATVRWQGIDVGNVGIGAPGIITSKHVTASWFERLGFAYGVPLIPVFNSANKAGILVDVAQNQAGAAVTVVSLFVELAPGAAPASTTGR